MDNVVGGGGVGKKGEEMIETVKDIAIIIYRDFTLDRRGIKFITDESCVQQVGIMKWPKGHEIQRHYHCMQPFRKAVETQEVLVIRKGAVCVQIYGYEERLERTVFLKEGDIICFLRGGHGIQFLEESEILEIKQGPYTPKEDKVTF
jgi:hypothetical protein